MKKLFALLLALVMMMSLVACGENTDGTTTAPTNPTNPSNPTDPSNPEVKVPESALALLQQMWAKYPEDAKYMINEETGEKVYIYVGGSFLLDEEGIPYYPGDNDAGAIDLTVEGALFPHFVAEEYYANVEEAASLFSQFNGNTFTSGALKLKEGTDVAALAKSVRDMIAGNFWMCGFPDRFIIASVGDYLVITYGHDGAGDENFKNETIVTPFMNAMSELYPATEILYNELIGA